MDAREQQWEGFVAPWRAVAEELGFERLDRSVDEDNCFDYLRDNAGTFLDLHGVVGETQGFWSATFTTWLDFDDGRVNVWNVAEKDPPPMPPDPVGGFLARLMRPVLRSMVPARARAAKLRTPGDLVAVIERHRERVRESGGRPVRFGSLEERFAQAKKDDATP